MDTVLCKVCKRSFDKESIGCFRRKDRLKGDIFFRYTCSACDSTHQERADRDPITWPVIAHLILYNLILRNPTKRFFKMKEDICTMILQYWDDLLPHKSRSSNWENTVSSCFSTHPDVFVSGAAEMGQTGWWTLKKFEPPTAAPILHRGRPAQPVAEAKPAAGPESEGEVDIETYMPSKTTQLLQESLVRMSPEQLEAFASRISKIRQSAVPLSSQEEWELCKRLHGRPNYARLFRKLWLRRLERNRNLRVFNLDEAILQYIQSATEATPVAMPSLFGMAVADVPHVRHPYLSFENRYITREIPAPYDPVISPYSSLQLKKFIHRDYESVPPKLGVLRYFSNQIHPIDFVCLSPRLVAPANKFLCEFFWPGIDVSEFLRCPEYSIVATYKRLVVGCACMIPETCYITFLLVHPDWERANIASYMLFHLIRLSRHKDITLHASASNNALMLYQKFGFKPEEFIVNFYDKYYGSENTASKNAFFLRLKQ